MPLRPASTNFWSNTDRSWSASSRRSTAPPRRGNQFAYDCIRSCRNGAGGYENWSWAYIFDRMYRGDIEGFFSFGMNPVSNGPHSRKAIAALAKLKWLVVAENFEQETAAFWRPDILSLVDLKPEDVQTEVFMLPAANFAEKDGSFVNSARWIQWKWKAVDPPGDAKPDQEIVARIFLKIRELYERKAAVPGADPQAELVVHQPGEPVARRGVQGAQRVGDRGRARSGGRGRAATGQQLSRFLDTRADGTTLSGNWLYIGMYTDAGNLTQRRSYADPSGLGRYPEWTVSWPANRRILYNRCSADCAGPAVGCLARRHRLERSAMGRRHARLHRRQRPDAGLGAFIMLPEGVARLFVPGSSSRARGRSITSRPNRRC